MDSKTTIEILEFMQEIVREQHKTLIMVSHDMEVAMYAGRIVHMLDGEITSIEENIENIAKLTATAEGRRHKMKKKIGDDFDCIITWNECAAGRLGICNYDGAIWHQSDNSG